MKPSTKQIELAKELGIPQPERFSSLALSKLIGQAIELRKTSEQERYKEAEEEDLLSLAGRFTTLKQTAYNNWAGPCPMPGCVSTRDGFWVNTNTNTGGCHSCDWVYSNGSGSGPIGFIRGLLGLSAWEARDWLVGGANKYIPKACADSFGGSIQYAKPEPMPDLLFQETAHYEIESCATALSSGRSQAAEDARQYLAGRGLLAETWQAFYLGQAINPHGQRIGNVIVIPWIATDGTITAIQYRLLKPKKREKHIQKYSSCRGSHKYLFGTHLIRPAKRKLLIATEGDLNACSIWQVAQANNLPIDVISFGSGKMGQLVKTLIIRLTSRYARLVVYADEPQDAQQLRHHIPTQIAISNPHAKDANDLLCQGELLPLLNALVERLVTDNWSIRDW